jgi:hypothetical protein
MALVKQTGSFAKVRSQDWITLVGGAGRVTMTEETQGIDQYRGALESEERNDCLPGGRPARLGTASHGVKQAATWARILLTLSASSLGTFTCCYDGNRGRALLKVAPVLSN